MVLKVRIAGENKDAVNEALKKEPVFIKDEYVDVKAGLELDWDNLYYVKIEDYYLSDIEYTVLYADDVIYSETITEISLSKDDSIATHIEKWEIEGVKNALKREIEII